MDPMDPRYRRGRRTTSSGDIPSRSFSWGPVSILAALVTVFVGIAAFAWVFSFHGTDSGEVCVIREGGPFDGRAIKSVRQPGEGPRPIGAFNHQDCIPTTERDSNDVIENADQTFSTKDAVKVITDPQVLFTFTTDDAKVKAFFRKYGRRQWGGHDITEAEGLLNFMRQRLAPVLLDTYRDVTGRYPCINLNNLCQYVQDPEKAAKGKVKAVSNTQDLSAAANAMRLSLAGDPDGRTNAAKKGKLFLAFGDNYFENIKVQNLRVRFAPEVDAKITRAQSLRTEVSNAGLEADRKVAQAKGEAGKIVAAAQGAADAAVKQAAAYRKNPTQRQIDRIKAFCGTNEDGSSKGCNPQVIGGNAGSVITQLGK